MARNQNETAAEAVTETADQSPVTPPVVAGGGDARSIVLTVGDRQIKRTDYIRQRWAEKAPRGLIAKELSEIQGKKVPYQVVFAATKGLAGGPDKAAPAEPFAAEGASE